MTSGVGVGDAAPDFTAQGTGGREYSLRDYKGNPVVLVFYPGDATPVCTEQLRNYSESFDEFTAFGAEILAISPQSIESHEQFREEHGFRFPLLFDSHKAIAEKYSVMGPLGFYRRSIFVVDGDGIIRYAARATAGLTFVKSDQLIEAVREATRLSH